MSAMSAAYKLPSLIFFLLRNSIRGARGSVGALSRDSRLSKSCCVAIWRLFFLGDSLLEAAKAISYVLFFDAPCIRVSSSATNFVNLCPVTASTVGGDSMACKKSPEAFVAGGLITPNSCLSDGRSSSRCCRNYVVRLGNLGRLRDSWPGQLQCIPSAPSAFGVLVIPLCATTKPKKGWLEGSSGFTSSISA